MNNNYPEEIYCYPETAGPAFRERGPVNTVSGRAVAEQAYDLGYKRGVQEATTETEWFNLTEAIASGAAIDWDRLDGVRARCAHESGAVYQHKLVRNKETPLAPVTMLEGYYPKGWGVVFVNAWFGDDGWTLYINRPVPTKRKTADQLEPGTCIRTTEGVLGMVYEDGNGIKGFWGANQKVMPADEVEVQTEYGIGTFKAVDDEA